MTTENPKARIVAKILARISGETEENVQNTLRQTYARYRKEGISFSDVVNLPDPLYQDGLIEFAKHIADQEESDGYARRSRYDDYLGMIASRFAAGQGSSSYQEPPRQEQSRGKEYSRNPGNTARQEKSPKTVRVGKFIFSFSPAAFFGALRENFSHGSLIWLCCKYPGRAGRLVGASLLFGAGAAFVILFFSGLVLGAFDLKLPFDLPLVRAITFLALPIAGLKALSLKNNGWF
jgi:hypothetical protein